MRSLVVLAAVLGASLGSSVPALARPSVSPSAFAVSVVRLLVANRYEEAWSFLVPQEKAVVSRALYAGCEERTRIPGHPMSVRALDVQPIAVAVPGSQQPLSGYAVTVQATIGGLANRATVVSQLRFYVVGHTHRLGWVLHADRFDAYRHGHCLSAPAPPA